jgi:2-polyprenyl-6-methoxyphenol hydroxylase-like FAD-dependent oxidoreductase
MAANQAGRQMERISTTCCIAGGGPAGIMAGFLLARAGVRVEVLEKHKDFFRDFRGDTIHPSTLQLMDELGLVEDFLKVPHQKVSAIFFHLGDNRYQLANFSKLHVRYPYIALMPQWDFLNFLATKAKRYPGFLLRMETEVTGLIEEEGRVAGVRAKTPQGEIEIFADLVLGCDGRHSVVREAAKLAVKELGAPIDVLWFHLSRPKSDPEETMARLGPGHFLVMLNRDTYWQCAFVIHKGGDAELRAKGLENFRKEVEQLAPFARGRMREIKDWDEVKLLTVAVDRLEEWARRGLLCIGDAAHAMSPVGGVGINLAVQDAVAAANLLWEPLREKRVTLDDLNAVQKRREFPTKATQRMQVFVQNNVLKKVLSGRGDLKVPWVLRLISHFPLFQRLPAYFIGVGARPEHIQSPEME